MGGGGGGSPTRQPHTTHTRTTHKRTPPPATRLAPRLLQAAAERVFVAFDELEMILKYNARHFLLEGLRGAAPAARRAEA